MIRLKTLGLAGIVVGIVGGIAFAQSLGHMSGGHGMQAQADEVTAMADHDMVAVHEMMIEQGRGHQPREKGVPDELPR